MCVSLWLRQAAPLAHFEPILQSACRAFSPGVPRASCVFSTWPPQGEEKKKYINRSQGHYLLFFCLRVGICEGFESFKKQWGNNKMEKMADGGSSVVRERHFKQRERIRCVCATNLVQVSGCGFISFPTTLARVTKQLCLGVCVCVWA